VAEFPTAAQTEYVQAVQAAIALAVLCRVDLTEAAENEDTGYPEFSQNVYNPGYGLRGLEGAGRDISARYGISPVWFKGTNPQRFRLRMRWLMARISSDLYERGAIPDSLASAIATEAAALRVFTWSLLDGEWPELTILESIGIGATPSDDEGVGANPWCRGLPRKTLLSLYSDFAERSETEAGLGYSLREILGTAGISEGVIPSRAPSFLWEVNEGSPAENEPPAWIPGQGSADMSPILYNNRSYGVTYIRNALITDEVVGTALLDAAVTILQLAGSAVSRPVGDTQWIAVRLMPQAFAPLDDLLDRLDRFLQGILDGLDGIVDKIVAYIEAIQARIYQLQALLEQIRALLRALEFFSLPAANGLVLVESGTDGITTGFLTAENKPSDSASSYGAGIAVVAGGMPTVLLELLALILSGGEEAA
jgi:hypothetical protein